MVNENIIKNLEKLVEEFKSYIIDDLHELSFTEYNKDIENSLNSEKFEYIYYSSYYILFKSMQMLNNEHTELDFLEYIKLSAESLEYLSNSKNIDNSVKTDIIFDSIMAYYISGNSPISFVLCEENKMSLNDSLDDYKKVVFNLLNKNLKDLRSIILEKLNSKNFNDNDILTNLKKGKIDENHAVSQMLSYSIFKSSNDLLNYIELGDSNFIKSSLEIIEKYKKIATKYNFVEYWWILNIMRYIVKEYYNNSLWKHLKKFATSEKHSEKICSYIKHYLNSDPPLIELWSSQIKALKFINNDKRNDFCVSMSTSSGKTMIAELTILKFFLDNNFLSKKVFYVAPFRSLANEIEKSLRKGLAHLNLQISEFYGGFEVNSFDNYSINDVNILILTPEKLDAFIRFKPELIENVGLIIIDEGHIVGADKRGLNFEFLIQRLKKLLKNSRFLYISAVLPNISEFSKWITGDPNNFIESKWKPSRLMIGELVWDENCGKINYMYKDGGIPFKQNSMNLINTIKCSEIPNSGRRKKDLPYHDNEHLALSGIIFATKGMTFIYAPKKSEVTSLAKKILTVQKLYGSYINKNSEEFKLKYNPKNERIIRLKRTIDSEMGNEDPLNNYLENGFLIHHKDLPNNVKNEIENVIKSGEINLIIGTTTLIQGMNFPIKTVIIKGINIGQYDKLNSSNFWNLCGRSGRALKEKEGSVLFFIDERIKKENLEKKRKDYKDLVESEFRVESGLKIILNKFIENWQKTYPKVNVLDIVHDIANKDKEWIPDKTGEKTKKELNEALNIVDRQLISIYEEFDEDFSSPEILEKIIKSSLMIIQSAEKIDLNKKIIQNRVNYLKKISPIQRKKFYKIGLSIVDCKFIEDKEKELFDLFKKSEKWETLTEKEKIDLLIKIIDFTFELKDITNNLNIPSGHEDIFHHWFKNNDFSSLFNNINSEFSEKEKIDIQRFLDDCRNVIPWGINSIMNFLRHQNKKLPEVCDYFSEMIKYNTIDIKLIILLQFLNNEKDIAYKLSKICPNTFDRQKISKWFTNVSYEKLNESLDKNEVGLIKNIINENKTKISKKNLHLYIFNKPIKLSKNESILIEKYINKNYTFKLYKLGGEFIEFFNSFDKEDIPKINPGSMWNIEKIEERNNLIILTLNEN